MRNKKAAMEMSMGTIVTIVLLMSVLVLGLVMVKNIFRSGTDALGKTDKQLESEVNKIYGDESKIGIYPTSRVQEIKQGKTVEVGLVIRNMMRGADAGTDFNYNVFVEDVGDCSLSEEQLMNFIILGEGGSAQIPFGETKVKRINFEIPGGAPLCTARYGVNVYVGETPYASDDFDLRIK